MRKNKAYLDYAATHPIPQGLMNQVLSRARWQNPNSIYSDGIESKLDIEFCREYIAHIIGAEPEEIIFTSGGSESNALAINGFLMSNPEFDCCICSNIEHSSVIENRNCRPEILVNKDGTVNLDTVPDERSFCAVMMVNNEIGTIQPIREIADRVHKNNGILFCDGVQALGKTYINVKDLDVDMMSFSGHKVGSLKGIGFLYVKKGIAVSPIIPGTQENGIRGGTYNHLGILSLRYALERNTKYNSFEIQRKRNKLLHLLTSADGIILNGSLSNRCPSNINVRLVNTELTGQQIVTIMDELGFQISAGSACHEGEGKPSHVLKAIGLSDQDAERSIRITIGYETTDDEIEEFAETLISVLGF